MKYLLSLITFKNLSVSARRKRAFRTTTLLLVCLILIQSLFIPPNAFVGALLSVAILTAASNILFNVIRLFVVSSHRKRRGISNEERDNFTVGVNALVNTATVFVAIVFTFLVFDIEFRAFLSSIALVAVALTLIFQDFIKNFLFGLSMMFSSDYEIGDYIQVAEMPKGVITTITFSNVQIKTETGNLLFVPNSVIRVHEVINFSKLKPKRMTIEFSLLREQLSSVEEVEKAFLVHIDEKHPNIIDIEHSHLEVHAVTKDEIRFLLELSSKKASLRLKELINRTVQKFAVAYK